MSATTSPTPAIRDFAAAVRVALSDLPAEDVEDLTDGLEADLTEQAEDGGTQGFDPEDAVAYADELRAAAGLPVRGKPRPASAWSADRLRARASTLPADLLRRARSTPFGTRALDFFISLRPFWWVLRGWAVYKVFEIVVLPNSDYHVIPTTALEWLLFLLIIMVSVQWGRGRWLPWSWLRPFKTLVSICSIVAVPLLLLLAVPVNASADQYQYGPDESYLPQGLLLGGSEVSNIFAYDADGHLLTGVQLFNQDGAPLTTVSDPLTTLWSTRIDSDGREIILVPSSDVTGRTGWNVFPLKTTDWASIAAQPNGKPDLSTATPDVPPFAQVQPLAGQEPTPTPTPAVPAPSATPTAAPKPSATPTANPGGDE